MRYGHTGIVSKDWKKPAQFYIDVFGCTIKPPERKLSGQWLGDATGLTNAGLEGAHLLLSGHGENGPTLEIFTKDVERTFGTALKNGAAPLGKVTVKEIDGIGHLQLVYFRDPDGNIVEIQSWNQRRRRLG